MGALALNVVNEEYLTLQPSGGAVQWTAPAEGEWQVWLVDHAFRTAVTRDVHNPTQEKDASSSLYDYLNPEGTQQSWPGCTSATPPPWVRSWAAP